MENNGSRRDRTLLFAPLVLASCLLFVQPSAAETDADRLLGKDRDKIFDQYVRQIRDFQIVNEKGLEHLNTSWARELEKSKRRFISAQSKEDVYYAFLSLQRSFHDAHSMLTADALRPERGSVRVPIRFLPLFNGSGWDYVVIDSKVPDVPVGSHLISMQGKTVAQLEADYIEWSPTSSIDALRLSLAKWLTYRRPWLSPSPTVGDTAQFTIATKGHTNDVELKWTAVQNQADPDQSKCGSRLNDPDYENLKLEFSGLLYCVYATKMPTTKIVRYFSFNYFFYNPLDLWNRLPDLTYKPTVIKSTEMGPGLLANLDQSELVHWLKKSKVKKVYLDMRENDGGNLPFILPAAFADKPFHSTTVKLWLGPGLRKSPELVTGMAQYKVFKRDLMAKPAQEYSSEAAFFCKTDDCKRDEAILPPTKELSKISLVVISGPACRSACDDYLGILRLNGIAKTAGMPSSGATSPLRTTSVFHFADGTPFSMSLSTGLNLLPNGESLEGNPPPIDSLVLPTEKNRGHYLEAVMSSI
jgi:hypothetical protein